MRVQFLIPPTDLSESYGTLKEFSNPQPSIGVAYIASLLREHGYEVGIVDAYAQSSSLNEIIDQIEVFSPDVLGISVLTPSTDVFHVISAAVRKRFPDMVIMAGNLHPSIFQDETLKSGHADYIVHREGEYTTLELLDTIQNNGDVEKVKGISYLKDGKVLETEPRPPIEDLDALPFPAWDLYPLHMYGTDPRTEVTEGTIERQILATRGCPSLCTFCSSRTDRSLGSKYRVRSPKNIVDEIEYMFTTYGSTVFAFMDLAFPFNRKHSLAVCDEIISRGLNKKIKWVTECRVKPLDEELLVRMKESGCVRINFGIESGNNEILQALKKKFTRNDVEKAVTMASRVGIETDGMFMIGLPGEDEQKVKETIEFAVGLDLRYAIFNIFVPYPGCELWDTLNASGEIYFNKWAEFTSYPTYSEGKPVYVPRDLTHERIMELQKYAMKRYYLRPKFIWGEIIRFKPSKFKAYFNGLRAVLS